MMLNDAVSNATVTQCRMLCINECSQYKRKNRIQRGRGLIQGVLSPSETEMNGKKVSEQSSVSAGIRKGHHQNTVRSAVLLSSL